MPRGAPPSGESSFGELFGRLIEDVNIYVRAEVGVVRAQALLRLARARIGVAMLGGALLLIGSAVTALLVACVFALAALTGPLLAGVIVALIALMIAVLLARSGARRIAAAIGGDEDDDPTTSGAARDDR